MRMSFLTRWIDLGDVLRSVRHAGLRAKLGCMMLALSFATAMLLFVVDSKGVRQIADAIQNQNEDLSQAFQISVEEITTQGFTNQARLQDFINTLKRKGVKEISILSNERQVMESSNPQKVGKVIPPRHKDFLVTGALGDEDSSDGIKRKIYNLVVPVIVRGEQLGYVNLKLHLEDFDSLLAGLRVKRIVAVVLVFSLGVIGSMFLATRYVQPIGSLVQAARRVASGDLSQKVEVIKQDEIGELAQTFNDMVERLRENQELQQRLARSEHLSRLGQLSAGIAHEVRNPLNYLNLCLDQLRDGISKNSDPSKMKESITRMKQEVLRLSHLVRNFLDYGKPLRLDMKAVDAFFLIEESLKMVEDKILDNGINVKTDVAQGLSFHGDREHLKSCFTNIILNSIQAMTSGGELSIKTYRDSAGQKAHIEFLDTGCGIAKGDLEKVGEPFFTTKDAGVGVGLAITKKIVAEHDGKFELTSQEGCGTCIRITIPVA